MKQVQQRAQSRAKPKAPAQATPARRSFVSTSNHRDAGPSALQPAAASAALDAASVVAQARSAPRVPLPPAKRMAREFGISLGALEVHQGAAARAACERIGARALAGQNIAVFADETPSRALVRHELAHVVQAGGRIAPPPRYARARCGSRGRQRAEREAALIARGRARGQLSSAAVAVYRAEGDEADVGSGAETEPDTSTAEGRAEAKSRNDQALARLVSLAESKELFTLEKGASKDGTIFGKKKPNEEGKFDPVFIESSKETWRWSDYRDVSGLADAAAEGDLSVRIFNREENGALKETALARMPIRAKGRYWWVSRVLPKDTDVDSDKVTQSYAFLGSYFLEGSSPEAGQAIKSDEENSCAVVNNSQPAAQESRPRDSLTAYLQIVGNIEKSASAKARRLPRATTSKR